MASVAADLPVAMETSRFAEVAVPVPVEGTFHYRVPEGMNLEVGHRVLVPFSGRKVTGFILGVPSPLPKGLSASKVKPILERLDVLPVLTPDVLALVRFASDYYLGPLGLALETALPPGLAAGSAQKLVITPAGRKALKAGKLPNELFLGPEEHDALTRSSRSGGARAGAIAPGLVRRLVEQGLIAERESLTTRRAVEAIELVERARAAEPNELSRAKARKKLYEALANGPVPVRRLAEELGAESLRSALRTLEKAGLVRRIEQPIPEGSSSRRVPEFPLSLTRDQTHALAEISKALSLRRGAFLLRGVTGSGKTEVYLRAIAAARAERRGAIVLVPEIALTSQLEARFRAHFGDDVVVLHSGLADGARRRGWARLLSGESGIALGARSAVWAPVRDLGVIVVDEEHDASFKQHTELRYNGRDLAMFRARREGAVTILGSATPSLEAVRLVEEGKLTELPLSSRATGRELPKVEVVDLSVLPRDEGEIPLFSRRLEEALREVVSKGEQAILFLNRRGFNTIVVCDECAAPRRCSRCSVTLIFHKRDARLVCHYCGHEEQLFAPCGSCGAKAMKPFGAGTERVATFVESTIPDAKVLRLDRDVTQNEGALAETLAAFRNREANVLVGTQMVAKGHDFPAVTLVGILLADASLAVPDFRAAERTFQLLTQVAGRAGRAELPGRVILQALSPGHYSIECAIKHDERRFVAIECESRRSAEYPPYSRLCAIRVESEDEVLARAFALRVRRIADERVRSETDPEKAGHLRIRGPVAAPIERIRGKFRFLALVFAPTPAKLSSIMREVKRRAGPPPKGVELILDVDAVDLL